MLTRMGARAFIPHGSTPETTQTPVRNYMLRRGELSQTGWGAGEKPDSKELHGLMPFLGGSKKTGGGHSWG